MLALPKIEPPVPLGLADPPLPIDDKGGGCDTPGQFYTAWAREHPGLHIDAGDVTALGIRCVLVRDLTDSIYNPQDAPHFSHVAGTQLVIDACGADCESAADWQSACRRMACGLVLKMPPAGRMSERAHVPHLDEAPAVARLPDYSTDVPVHFENRRGTRRHRDRAEHSSEAAAQRREPDLAGFHTYD